MVSYEKEAILGDKNRLHSSSAGSEAFPILGQWQLVFTKLCTDSDGLAIECNFILLTVANYRRVDSNIL